MNHKPQTYRDPKWKKRYFGIGAILLVIAALSIMLWALSEDEREVTFPYFAEGDKIEITQLFQYSGFNPDCGDEMGENIASLAVVNRSNEHLSYLELSVDVLDGGDMVFEITDLPAGQTAWVFSKDNLSCEMDAVVRDIDCTAKFETGDPRMTDKIQTQVSGTTVFLTNLTGEDLTDLTVSCRTWFGEAYFGGLTYQYPVDSLPAGQTVTLEAEDCYLGEAAVVRISEKG